MEKLNPTFNLLGIHRNAGKDVKRNKILIQFLSKIININRILYILNVIFVKNYQINYNIVMCVIKLNVKVVYSRKKTRNVYIVN